MIFRYILIIIVLSFACASISAPPKSPAKPSQNIINIPKGETSHQQSVEGKLTLIATLSSDVDYGAIVFSVDGKEISRATKRPFRAVWDSMSVPNGDHIVKWTAVGSNGEELDSGAVTLNVMNKSRVTITEKNPSEKTAPAIPIAFSLYRSPMYNVNIEFPSSWTVRDESANLPKDWEDGYWLVLSTLPVNKAAYIVNLRHRLLQQSHTAESFKKHTPYIASWEKTTVNGKIAFLTTAGSPSSKRVVHRAMMLQDRHLWMVNCIDTSGGPVSDSKSLFMRMINSITLAEPVPETEN